MKLNVVAVTKALEAAGAIGGVVASDGAKLPEVVTTGFEPCE